MTDDRREERAHHTRARQQCAKRPSCLRAPERAMPLGFGDPPAHVTCPTACPWTSPTPVAVRPHGRAPLC